MPVRDPGGTLGAVAAGVLSWRRNLAALTAASFIGFTGFTLVMPFLPLYIAELGVRDVGRIALWTGMTLGVTPALTALLAPAWGRLADRFGRKLMVARSLASFVVIMAAMAWVTSPWHLFALRAVQGLFAGYGALCLAMAADSSPRDRIAQSIGMVQTAQRLGPALGPVLGGLVAGAVGLRAAFLVTSVFYLVALVQLLVLYHEPGEHHASAAAAPSRVTFANVLAFENFLLLMAAIFGLQFVDRSFGPVLPLHVASLGVRPSHVAVVSGVVFSTLACSAAVGHHVCARLLRRWSARVVISRAALVAAFAVALFLVVGNAWALVPTAAVFGGCIGAAMTAAYAAAAGVVPATVRGASFGFLSSASLAGLALSPAICGFLAATDIRIVFAADALALCVLAMLVRRVMIEHPRVTETPVVADA
jgi:DHA1 family multidrug resistance protein-like MFS transporter